MSILSQLSSQVKDNTEESNRKVAAKCLENPALLKEIAMGLNDTDSALMGDCAEIFTKVAGVEPQHVLAYIDQLISLLNHKNTRVRWETMHTISLATELIPEKIKPILPSIKRSIVTDKSTIVRDYAVETISKYAKTSRNAANEALSLLVLTLDTWENKHAARALRGLRNALDTNVTLKDQIVPLVKRYMNSSKGTIRKAANELNKTLQA